MHPQTFYSFLFTILWILTHHIVDSKKSFLKQISLILIFFCLVHISFSPSYKHLLSVFQLLLVKEILGRLGSVICLNRAPRKNSASITSIQLIVYVWEDRALSLVFHLSLLGDFITPACKVRIFQLQITGSKLDFPINYVAFLFLLVGLIFIIITVYYRVIKYFLSFTLFLYLMLLFSSTDIKIYIFFLYIILIALDLDILSIYYCIFSKHSLSPILYSGPSIKNK